MGGLPIIENSQAGRDINFIFEGSGDTADHETPYLNNLRAAILNSDPPWHPDLYVPVQAKEGYKPDPAFWAKDFWPTIFPVSRSAATLTDAADLLDQINLSRVTVLTGSAGSGKSVILRQFALALISRALDHNSPDLPVLIDLKHYKRSESAFTFFKRHLTGPSSQPFTRFIGENLEDYLLSGRLVFLLDGMDEMPRPRQGSDDRLDKLKKFTHDYPANRFVFTCRTLKYDEKFQAHQYLLEDLSDAQIDEFISRSFSLSDARRPQELEVTWLKQNRPDVVETGRNPFRLRMLVSYHKRKGCLPRTMGELYEEFVRQLLNRSLTKAIDINDVRRVLSEVALGITEDEGVGVPIDLDDIEQMGILVNSSERDAFAVGIESGILTREPGTDAISFTHHRLQEYFAAISLEETCSLYNDPSVLDEYIDDIWSQEIITILVGLLERPEDFIRYLVDSSSARFRFRLFLAADCLKFTKISRSLRIQITELLKQALNDPNVIVRVRAIKALGNFEPEVALPLLSQSLSDSSPWVQETCLVLLQTIRRNAGNEPIRTQRWATSVEKLKAVSSPLRIKELWKPYWPPISLIFIVPLLYFLFYLLIPEVAYGFFRAGWFFVGFSLMLLVVLQKLRYESGLFQSSGGAVSSVIKYAILLIFIAIPFALGLIFLRPIPFLAATIASLASAWLAKLIVAKQKQVRSARVYFAWKVFVPGLVCALIFSSLGVFGEPDAAEVLASLASLCLLVMLLSVPLNFLVDRTSLNLSLRSLEQSSSTTKKKVIRRLLAIASKEEESFLAINTATTNLARRRAIRALGHLDYSEEIMDRLESLMEEAGSSLLRDTAAQAIDEIQQRQRLLGKTEGLYIKPHHRRAASNNDSRLEFFHVLLMLIFGIVMLPSSMPRIAFLFGEIQTLRSHHILKAFVLGRLYFEREAVTGYEERLKMAASDPVALNQLAWLLATSEDANVQNPKLAIQYALRAVEEERWTNTQSMDTLAEAYFRAGMYQQAFETISRASVAAPGNDYLEIRQRRFSQFASSQAK